MLYGDSGVMCIVLDGKVALENMPDKQFLGGYHDGWLALPVAERERLWNAQLDYEVKFELKPRTEPWRYPEGGWIE